MVLHLCELSESEADYVKAKLLGQRPTAGQVADIGSMKL
jgi:hypothetical protein